MASELVEKLGTNLIDQANGQLTGQAKDELTKLIGDQGASVFGSGLITGPNPE